ncbi:MAG: M48 family metallopeptidase [Chromatiales bacterium]|nr:M48 family metallopeptidase [Chromatiales bacterium]
MQNRNSNSQIWREAVTLRRNRRAKYVRLRIYPPGQVEVVIPHNFDERALPQILEQHTPWVEERLRHYSTQERFQLAPPQWLNLEAIEERWRVEYQPGNGQRSSCRTPGEGELVIAAPTPEQQREMLKRWLARRAKEVLPPWLEQTSRELSLPFSGVSIRGQRTRWGSCSSRGAINLNYALLFLQPDLVRYLFVHELCHTVHLNHSRKFWALVKEKEPHYRSYEQALKQASAQVPTWLYMPFQIAPS